LCDEHIELFCVLFLVVVTPAYKASSGFTGLAVPLFTIRFSELFFLFHQNITFNEEPAIK
jgi:hypothetical protein